MADTHDEHAKDALHDAAAHAIAGGHGDSRHVTHPPELPHFVQMAFEAKHGHDYGSVEQAQKGELSFLQVLHAGRRDTPAPFVDYAPWENNLFAGIAAIFLILATIWATKPFRRNRQDAIRKPTRLQIAMEGLAEGMDGFCRGILGDVNGRRYMPFIAGMFLFILIMNLMGMVPFMKAPTSSLLITASLAITTFIYYVYIALTRLGPVELFKHLCGSPTNVIQWCLAPLMFVIECISFFVAKPLSLALRLFGNILGKDILFGVMLGLGIMLFGFSKGLQHFVGFPLTYPFYFLGLLLSTIQALVFSLLSAIYILMVLPHDHDHGHEGHGHEGHDGHDHGAHAH